MGCRWFTFWETVARRRLTGLVASGLAVFSMLMDVRRRRGASKTTFPRRAWEQKCVFVSLFVICGCEPSPDTLRIRSDWDLAKRATVERISGQNIQWLPVDRQNPDILTSNACDLMLLSPESRLRYFALVSDPISEADWLQLYRQWVEDASSHRQNQTSSPNLPNDDRWISMVSPGPREVTVARLMDQLTREYGPPLMIPSHTESTLFSLFEDLLDSTLEEALPELSAVDHALQATPLSNERARAFLVEPPPWPPASIQILNATEGSRDLVLTLASQIAPDLESRHWLLASWSGGSRHVSPGLLNELAKVADGKLGTEPRFRAWLRSEWTNWARQRYRRVARLAAQGDQP